MLKKIISGGQTGVDRMALEVAKRLGIETGGTAAKGWLTEVGPDPSLKEFGLIESESSYYPDRTSDNVFFSDGTVLFGNEFSAGSLLVKKIARSMMKPLIINPTAQQLDDFIVYHRIKTLNVAGNRMSNLTTEALKNYQSILTQVLAGNNSSFGV